MKVRDYLVDDVGKLVELYNETTLSFNWGDLNDEQKEVMLFKDLDFPDKLFSKNHTLVLEVDGEILGFVMMKPDGYVQFLYVKKTALRKGFGRKLLNSIELRAKENSLNKVHLFSSEYASRFQVYEKLGFENLGAETYKIAGVDFRGNRMEKTLV